MADPLITTERALVAIPDVQECDHGSINDLIASASALVAKFTGREFLRATRTERYSGGNTDLFLDNYPVISVDWIAAGRTTALSIRNTGAIRAFARAGESGLALTRTASGTTTTDESVTWSDNATVSAVAAAVNSLGNGWSATVTTGFGEWPSDELYDGQGGSYCLDRSAEFKIFDDYLENVAVVNPANGRIYKEDRFPYGVKNVSVRYTAGYSQSELPDDLQEAIAALVAAMWSDAQSETGNNSGIRREKLGDYEYERFEKSSLWPTKTLQILTMYRRLDV